MRLRLALLLRRLRGPLEVSLTLDRYDIGGHVVLCRYGRRYVTVWTLWDEKHWDENGDKFGTHELTIWRVPWSRVHYVSRTIGRARDD